MPSSTRLLAGASSPDQDTGPEGEDEGVASEGGGLGRGKGGRRDGMFDNLPTQTVSGDGSYTAVLIVPTGIGAAIGGYAGDALPVARYAYDKKTPPSIESPKTIIRSNSA